MCPGENSPDVRSSLEWVLWSAQQVWKSHAMIRTDSMYKQCGWTNTQDKDITVCFPRRKRLMLHINIWTLHNYQLVHFVHSLHIFACLCGIGKDPKWFLSMCVIYLSNRIICAVVTKADVTNKISNIGQCTLITDLRCQIFTLPFKTFGVSKIFGPTLY